jgi:hypothetical protein
MLFAKRASGRSLNRRRMMGPAIVRAIYASQLCAPIEMTMR